MSAFEPTSTPWVGSSSTSTRSTPASGPSRPSGRCHRTARRSASPTRAAERRAGDPLARPRRSALPLSRPPLQNVDSLAIVMFSRTPGSTACVARSAGTQHNPRSIAARAPPGGRARRRPRCAAARSRKAGEQPGDLLAARSGEAGDTEHLAGADFEVEVADRGAEQAAGHQPQADTVSAPARSWAGVDATNCRPSISSTSESWDSSPACTVAISRPSRRTVTVSQRPSTSSRMGDEQDARPARGDESEGGEQAVDLGTGQRCRGLVEDQQRHAGTRVGEGRERRRSPFALMRRECRDHRRRVDVEAEALDRRSCPPPLGTAVELGHPGPPVFEAEVVCHVQRIDEAEVLVDEAQPGAGRRPPNRARRARRRPRRRHPDRDGGSRPAP